MQVRLGFSVLVGASAWVDLLVSVSFFVVSPFEYQTLLCVRVRKKILNVFIIWQVKNVFLYCFGIMNEEALCLAHSFGICILGDHVSHFSMLRWFC